MPSKNQLSKNTRINQVIANVKQQTTNEPSPQITIKLTESQINQLEKIGDVLGLAVGVMLNSVAKYKDLPLLGLMDIESGLDTLNN